MGVHEVAAAVLADWLKNSHPAFHLCALDGLGAHRLLCGVYLVASVLRERLVPQGWLVDLTLTLGGRLQCFDALAASDLVKSNWLGRYVSSDDSVFCDSVREEFGVSEVALIRSLRLPSVHKHLCGRDRRLDTLIKRPRRRLTFVIVLRTVRYRLNGLLCALYDTEVAFFIHLLNFAFKAVLEVRLLFAFESAFLRRLRGLLGQNLRLIPLCGFHALNSALGRVVLRELAAGLLGDDEHLAFVLVANHRCARLRLANLAKYLLLSLIDDPEQR